MCRTGRSVLKEYSTFNHAVFYELRGESLASFIITNICNISVFSLTYVNIWYFQSTVDYCRWQLTTRLGFDYRH